jgi:sRNA-binding carbon storage regulator CsrA
VEIQILDIGPTQVKIGIIAPGTMPVQRKEVVLTSEQNMTSARGLEADEFARLLGRVGAGLAAAGRDCPNSDRLVRNSDTSVK